MSTVIERYWFFTWTTYGQWLPGDPRGSVTRVRQGRGSRFEHDVIGTPFDTDIPVLYRSAQQLLKGSPVVIDSDQALVLFNQFQETAEHRDWLLAAVAIMANHIHLVAGVPGDPDPADVLGSFKSYATRALNKRWERPESGTWWTESGSKRKLEDERSIYCAIEYVRGQEYALLIWINPIYDKWRLG